MAYTTIDKPSDYFNGLSYTGNNTATSYNNGLDMSTNGGLVWLKTRNAVGDHGLFDSVRGINKRIRSNTTNAEDTLANNGVTSFDSTGFSLGSVAYNDTPYTFMSWSWIANGTSVSNTDGSISSTVSANTTSGFSIVSYTGNSTSGATVGHGLGAVPSMIIWKDLGTNSWGVYHKSLGNTNAVFLDLTNASTSFSTLVNNTTPSSSLITLGSSTNSNNSRGMIAYCFAEKQGYSKFGSYIGNGNADGTFVYTGFKPAWVMVKRTDTTGNWVMVDSKRDTFNVCDAVVSADISDAEYDIDVEDFTAQGFKMRDNHTTRNASGGTYIYMCFASNPFVSSTGVPATAR